jgi:hypothetical protein
MVAAGEQKVAQGVRLLPAPVAGGLRSDEAGCLERGGKWSKGATVRGPGCQLNYEATIEDPEVFTRPWKISMPLYRRKERNAQVLEFKCIEFAEDVIYGHLRKVPIK